MTPYNFRRTIGYSVLIAIFLVLLAACAAPFDHNEHSNLTSINQVSAEGKIICSTVEMARTTADNMWAQSQWIYIYSSNLDGNAEMIRMAKNLMDMTKEFQLRYYQSTPPSRTYCLSKVENIHEATGVMLRVSGRRAR